MLKSFIKHLIGDYTVARVKRVMNKLRSGKNLIVTEYPLDTIEDGYHTFFGYYDHTPANHNKILYLTANEKMSIGINKCVDVVPKKEIKEIMTHAINWQQGDRLYWIGKDRFLFNDFDGENYISREVFDNHVVTHPWPIYDSNGEIAISVDFTRLGYLRPGYGYTDLSFPDITEESTAISVYKLSTEELLYSVKYEDIIAVLNDDVNIKQCYINHISISPDGKKFLFFFIEKRHSVHMCYLCLCESGQITLLEEKLSASHYTWRDNTTIMTTSYDDKRNCKYYMYDISLKQRKVILENDLVEDGHPTFVTDTIFITDTYPDAAGYQRIKMINLETKEIDMLIEIYSTSKHMGVERCDLHPRYDRDNKKLYFDADVDGHRRLYILNLEEHRWIKEEERKN